MQIELNIKEILKSEGSAKNKANNITKFMSWNKKKLIIAIEKYGPSSKEGRAAIIKEFWGK